MYILAPIPHETIWGGNKLKKYCESCMGNLGHLYMINGHDGLSNVILNGSEKGKTLQDVFLKKKSEWNMTEYEEFPLTIALVDARENLSIQVHPDDEVAEQLENRKIGKKESWLFLDAPNDGWIYAGCECKTCEQVAAKCNDNAMEAITSHFDIQKGDCVCVNAGTLHALTAGSLVYEIEYGSDFTYRFYDYDRIDEAGNKRELQVEKANIAIKPEVKPCLKKSTINQWLSETEYEIAERKEIDTYVNEGSKIECISILEAEGELESIYIKGGMSIMLFPGERISGVKIHHMIVARMR